MLSHVIRHRITNNCWKKSSSVKLLTVIKYKNEQLPLTVNYHDKEITKPI